MEEQQQLNSLAVTHLLQHTLRSLCIHDSSQWVYAVFWRILPRNYPPPKWDLQGGMYDRTRGNRRNWILVWEDGFCNFAASVCEPGAAAAAAAMEAGLPGPSYGRDGGEGQVIKGLQPELFFKMSHEIYNYGEGLIGKVAADHSHRWVFKEPQDHQEINFLSSWNNPADSHPRTWEAQFQSGIKTIALIAVREGVVQLGAINKVAEDLSYVVLLRKKFAYLESIPGVLLPHPSSSGIPISVPQEHWSPYSGPAPPTPAASPMELYDQYLSQQATRITPSMSSLEALLSKLPSVGPPAAASSGPASPFGYYEMPMLMPSSSVHQRPAVAKEEMVDAEEYGSSSMSTYYVNGE